MSRIEEQKNEPIRFRIADLLKDLPKKTLEDLANPEKKLEEIYSPENSATISRSRKEQLSELYNNQIKKIAMNYDLTEKEVVLLLKDQKEQEKESKKVNKTELKKLFDQQVKELAQKYNLPENEVINLLRNQRLEKQK